jgi:hypothetical protein
MSELKLTADSGGGTVSLKGPASTTSNADVPFVLPVADGSAGQYLKTDGSKNLGWSSDSGKLVNIATTSVVGEVSAETAQGATATSPLISLNYAAASASNKLLILASISIAVSSTAKCGVTLYINGSAEDAYRGSAHGNRQRVSAWTRPGASDRLNSMSINYVKTSPSTSSVTYGLHSSHAHDGTQTVYMNHSESGNYNYEARGASTLTILEIAG